MKRRDDLTVRSFGAALGLALLAPVLPGCLAAEKSVGLESETDSGSQTESGSDTESGSQTDGPSSDSQSSTDPAGPSTTGDTDGSEDSGSTDACAQHTSQEACFAAECGWAEPLQVEAGGDFCGFTDTPGFCYDVVEETGSCAENPVCAGEDPIGFWYREQSPGVWEVVDVDEANPCATPPPGFQPCRYDGADPPVCGCVCASGGTATLPPGFEYTLSPEGCADITLYAANPANSIMLSMVINQNLASIARETMQTIAVEIDATAFDIFTLVVGQNVSALMCTDVFNDEPTIAAEWTATAGTVSVEVQPLEGGSEGAFATMTLNNVQMINGGDVVLLDAVTYEDVFVGWLPG